MDGSRWIVAAGMMLVVLFVGSCHERARVAAVPDNEGTSTPIVDKVVDGLQEPVALVFLSKSNWLVAERTSGRIRWIENGKLRPEPFAVLPVPPASESPGYGLLGLAVDPQYPQRPYVYALYTVPTDGDRASSQRVVRFTVSDGKGIAPAVIIENLPVGTESSDNGGHIMFGMDGKLYVAMGDTQHPDLAQNYEALPGKVLRYNPDGTIPTDNPLEQQKIGSAENESNPDEAQPLEGLRTPVYTIGHRNPFGITQNTETGAMYLTDNGPGHGDDIVCLVAGDNYGWPAAIGESTDPRYHPPLWTAGKKIISPTGITVYTGNALPQFHGNLFFASYADGKLRRITLSAPDTMASVTVVPAAGDNARLDVVMGPDGNLYFTSLTAIYRLRAK